LAAADALAVLGACGVVTLAWSIATGLPIGHEPGIVGLSIGAPFVWLGTSVACHAHRARCAGTAVDELASLFRAGALTMAGLALLGIALGARVPRTWLVGVGLLATLAVATVRMAVRWWLAVEHRQRWTETRIVVVGAGDEGRQLARAFRDDPDSHLRPVAFVDDRLPPGARVGDLAVAGPGASAGDRARALAASGRVLTRALGPERLAATVRAGLAAGLEVQLSSQLSDVAHNRLVPLAAGRSPLVRVEPWCWWRPCWSSRWSS
jgi:FlaA1/EpsC-like NDP-sugar epimerase